VCAGGWEGERENKKKVYFSGSGENVYLERIQSNPFHQNIGNYFCILGRDLHFLKEMKLKERMSNIKGNERRM
jgi:hypothetical protein